MLDIMSKEDCYKFQEYLDKISSALLGPTPDHMIRYGCPICRTGTIMATRFGTGFAIVTMVRAECSECGYVMLFNKKKVFPEKFKKKG